jgi:CBS domain-containing protein
MKAGILRFLSSMPHFSFLTKDEMDVVVSKAVTCPPCQSGHPISTQGKTPIKDVLVIMKGQLSLYQDDQGEPKLSGYIKQGEVFGGISVMLNAGISLRTAKVDTDLHAISIPGTVIMEMCAKNKSFYEYFLANFSSNIFDKSLDAITWVVQARLFLSDIVPFTFLPEEEIVSAAGSLSRVSYPKGTVLFVQGKTRVGYLYILQRGAAERYYEENGEKTMRGILSEGDIYGGISMLLNDGIAVRTMEVVENSTFCMLPSHVFFELCRKHGTFSDFFSDTFGKRMLSRSYAAIVAKTLHPKEDSLQFFNQPLSHIYSRNPVFCDADASIRDAAICHG